MRHTAYRETEKARFPQARFALSVADTARNGIQAVDFQEQAHHEMPMKTSHGGKVKVGP